MHSRACARGRGFECWHALIVLSFYRTRGDSRRLASLLRDVAEDFLHHRRQRAEEAHRARLRVERVRSFRICDQWAVGDGSVGWQGYARTLLLLRLAVLD